MSRWVLMAAGALGIALGGATTALACAYCDDPEYAPNSAYIDYRGMTDEQQREADAKALAEYKAAAMDQARSTFLMRFAGRIEPAPQQAEAPSQDVTTIASATP